MSSVIVRRSILLFALSTVVLGCGGEVLQAQWLDREIAIDGDPSDWRGVLRWMDKAQLDFGALNDGKNLYVCLIVGGESDRRQIMARGMTLWFDPQGGDKQTIGIRYPIGFSNSDLSPQELEALAREMRDRQRDGDQAGAPSDDLASRFEASLAVIEMLQGPSVQSRFDPGAVPGVEVTLKATSSSLVYELKMPLRGDSNYALHVEPGAKLGVSLSTPDIDMEALQERTQGSRGAPPAEGMGGDGMGGQNMGGGRPPAGRMMPPEALDLKATLQLATPDA